MATTNQNQTTAVATAQDEAGQDKGKVTYLAAGQNVTLSYQIVRDFLTKGNGNVTNQDLTQFISICRYNELNPFLNEAYLIKFGTNPATMVVSKEAYMKRAEANEKYEGIQAGIILIRDNQIVEVEGCFYLPTDTLVGGWAKVYRADRKFPTIAKVNLAEYDKKQSLWNDKPSTMISKVAKVQALREAFPAQLGALYTHEEVNIEDAEYIELTKAEIASKANVQEIGFDATPEQASVQTATSVPVKETSSNKSNGAIPF